MSPGCRMEVKNILFLGGAKRVAMARLFKEAGARRGLKVNIFGYELDRRVPLACEGEIIIGERWYSPSIYEHIAEVHEKRGISAIIPFVDPAVEIAAVCSRRLPGVFAAAGDAALARTMFDKVEADRLFHEKGIAVPARVSAESPRYPFIAKPRTGSASKGIVVVRDGRQGTPADFKPEDYLLQEYVADAVEYTVDCYVSADGLPLAVVPRRRIEVTGGEVSVTQTEKNSRLMSLATEALLSLGLRGPVTLQYLFDSPADRYLLMEINPRLGGGAVCAVHAGADLPGFILDEAAGKVPAASCDWRDGTYMTRYMQEVVF